MEKKKIMVYTKILSSTTVFNQSGSEINGVFGQKSHENKRFSMDGCAFMDPLTPIIKLGRAKTFFNQYNSRLYSTERRM